MTSIRQIKANRQNALKSSGPRTAAGKAQSGRNAVTHGLTAQNVLLSYEDPNAFAQLRQDVLTSLNPQSVFEAQLADRAAGLLWRLRRVPTLELALFQLGAEHADPLDFIGNLDEADESEIDKLARVVKELLKADVISRLSRYEASLHKQLFQTLKSIMDLKASDPSTDDLSSHHMARKGKSTAEVIA